MSPYRGRYVAPSHHRRIHLIKLSQSPALLILVLAFMAGLEMTDTDALKAQDVNYDESKVPAYKLPDPLVGLSGNQVTDSDSWNKRREEILGLFREHVYGVMPEGRVVTQSTVTQSVKVNLPGSDTAAILREVTLEFSRKEKTVSAKLVCVLPLSERPCPVFLGYNFGGNHTICKLKEISINKVWNRGKLEAPGEETRGKSAGRWPLAKIINEGFGVVTIYYGDVDPDFDDGFKNGVHSLYPELQNQNDNWSSIGAWAWAIHRTLDYLESVDEIDSGRVVLLGHSRLGKTALWAGATDSRFSIVISNNSGCGGAALARRRYGEKVSRINTVFPHWFCKRHRDYNDNEDDLPVDQHMLISFIAPSPIYVASSEKDRWSDPRGEFLSLFYAQPVYQLLGKDALGTTKPEMPNVNEPLHGDGMAYHIRSGRHDIKAYDWEQYLSFCNAEFDRMSSPNGNVK